MRTAAQTKIQGADFVFAVTVHQDVRRLDIPTDQTALVNLAECRSGAAGHAQVLSKLQRCTD
jgi:hypothetical protein